MKPSLRWRAMRTAPQDGTYILLAYPSFSDEGKVYVGHGRWVDVPHDNLINRWITENRRDEIPVAPFHPHWEVSYVSVLRHCRGLWERTGYDGVSVTVRNPLGWMPVPEPSAAMKRRAKR